MKKISFARALIVTVIVLGAGATIGGWALVTHTATIPPVQDNIYFGSSQVVYKLNGRDGSLIWKQSLTRSTPLDIRAASHFGVHVVDNIVYAFMDQDFYAFKADNGKEIWHQHIMPVGSLTTEDLRIYNEIIDHGTIYLLHANSTISARSAKDGTELWSNYTIQGNFSVSNGGVYARVYSETGQGSTFYAFNAATGQERWHFMEQGYMGTPFVIAENGIVYDVGSALYALNEHTGQQIWVQTLPHNNPSITSFFRSPQLLNGTLYISTSFSYIGVGGVPDPDFNPFLHIYAFNAKTGNQLWISDPGYTQADWVPITSEAIIATQSKDNTAIVSVIDPQNGKTLWKMPFTIIHDSENTAYDPWIELVDGTLYVVDGSSKQKLQAFDVHNGNKLSEQPLGFTLSAYDRGGVSNGTAYILSGPTGSGNRPMETLGKVDRAVDAFRLSDGSHAWQFKPGMLKGYQDAISSLVLAP
ncbi:MAG TPA: PQQ-binding-like beta-propeller repeat protein [Ktedonosporobacter sp.]|nr:PQQ-binding-like beta-propeller repeat protein [Ktedonosporobacter sp.]